ncbi:TPA: M20 family metallopeptidase [Providencia rettgeri]|nr:M20 family metallopeptidase [Providencia rettgeri]HEM8141449.1 M20 family metallopeptidase [Providencia rettgeri]
MYKLNKQQQNELLELLCALIRHKSENPPGEEQQVAEYIYRYFKKENIDVEMQEVASGRPNVIAYLKGTGKGKHLLFNGHIDVVPCGCGWSTEPFDPVIKDGKVFGRGAADMKSGVAAMMYAATLLKRNQDTFSGDLTLVFNVDEERINLGMFHYIKDGISADYAIIGEPTSLDVCIAHKGVSRYNLSTKGTAGHAAKTRYPDSAISKMAKILPALELHRSSVEEIEHQLLGNASMIITTINGGTAPNIVPQHCDIEIDRRLVPGEDKQDIEQKIHQVIAEYNQGEEIEYHLDNYLFIPASDIPVGHELTQAALETVSRFTEKTSQPQIFEATCEAPFFSVTSKIPTLIMGPGGLAQAHVKDEFVEISELYLAAEIYYDMANTLLNK